MTDARRADVAILDLRDCKATSCRGCLRPPLDRRRRRDAGRDRDQPAHRHDLRHRPVSNDVSVIDGASCNATRDERLPRSARCTSPPGSGARGIAVNEATDTVYVANTAREHGQRDRRRDVQRAGAHAAAASRPRWRRSASSPRRVAVDELTNTVYVTNAGSNTVTMLNGRTCNGRVHQVRSCRRRTVRRPDS